MGQTLCVTAQGAEHGLCKRIHKETERKKKKREVQKGGGLAQRARGSDWSGRGITLHPWEIKQVVMLGI